MKPIFLISILISLSSFAKTYLPNGCGTQTKCKETKNAKGELNGEQTCVNFYKPEIVLIKAHWVNDQLNDDFFCANDEGDPKVEAHYKMGELDGIYKEYDKSLKTWGLEENYKAGKRQGLSKRKISNGRTIVKFFKDDKQYGYELLVDDAGKLLDKRSCQVENSRKENAVCDKISIPGFEKLISNHNEAAASKEEAQKNREVLEKFPDGKTKHKYKLVNGKIDGTEEAFFKNGKPSLVAHYKEGKKVDETLYFEEGQEKSKTLFKDHWPYQVTEYYQNGKVKLEQTESELEKLKTKIEFKRYFDNGKLSESGTEIKYAGDYRTYYEGEHKYFTKEGQPQREEFYINGKREGDFKEYTDNFDYTFTYKNDVLISKAILEKGRKKVLKKSEYMPDGSIKSEFISPGFKEK